jgi:hypothetical protein
MANGRAKAVLPTVEASTEDLGDGDLVKAASEGHEWAWSLLVDRFAPAVWSVSRARDLTPQESAEIFRMTWMRTADRLSVITPGSIGSWLQDTAERERSRIRALEGRRANA